MATRSPPRYVPTLTEIVKASAQGPGTDTASAQDQLVHRVMQRIDISLERRVREAVAATVIEQTRLLLPALRTEIEQVVRDTVSDAFAQEFGPQPQRRP